MTLSDSKIKLSHCNRYTYGETRLKFRRRLVLMVTIILSDEHVAATDDAFSTMLARCQRIYHYGLKAKEKNYKFNSFETY